MSLVSFGLRIMFDALFCNLICVSMSWQEEVELFLWCLWLVILKDVLVDLYLVLIDD